MTDPRPAATVNLVAGIWGEQVLATVSESGAALPELLDDWPDTADLLAVVEDPAATIMAPATLLQSDPRVVLHVVQLRGHPADRAGVELVDVEALAPADVVAAVRRGTAVFHGRVSWPVGRPRWFASGWRGEVEEWIDRALAGAGWHRAGPSEIVKFWSLSAVLQIRLDPGVGVQPPVSAFFKATCDLFHAEPVITQFLSRLRPEVMPELVGVDGSRAWMLMRPFPQHDRRSELAPVAAHEIARLQVAALGHLDELRALGAVDRGRQATVDGLASVVHESVELDQLTADERRTTRQLLPWLTDEIQALADGGLPVTLGHGDLHLGNVAAADGRLVLYDWTDAAVTFPVLDAALLAHSAGDAYREATLAAFAEVWREGYSAAVVERALQRAPLVNWAYQTISYEGIYRAQEEHTRWEMRGIVARTLRTLGDLWRERDELSG